MPADVPELDIETDSGPNFGILAYVGCQFSFVYFRAGRNDYFSIRGCEEFFGQSITKLCT